MSTNTKQRYFFSQPHQPFFLLAVINAIVMMLIFALSYKGILSLTIENLTFHTYSLIFFLFSNAFSGFLFTTFPRFNQTEVIDKRFYVTIFYANALGATLFVAGAFTSVIGVILGMLVTLLSQLFTVKKLYSIYIKGKAADKTDSFWILIAFYFGLVGNTLFILSLFYPSLLNIAINISFYMFIIFLGFSVGQRMIPFFSHSFAQKDPKFIKVVFGLFLLTSVFSSSGFKVGEIIIDLILAAYMFWEFRRWELHPLQSPPILWVLHLALFWLPVAFFISAITLTAEIFQETSFYFLNIHLLAIGFLTTVLIGFGTRVILGHSGQPPHGDSIATKIFYFIQAVVILRALFSLNIAYGWGLNFLFDISFTAWLLLFLVWGGRYFKTLIYGTKL
ncbi:NnrS family protein [Sulfurimonas sp.]